MDVTAIEPHLGTNTPSEIVETFPLARFRFQLQAETSIQLPGFKGSALHGGFGHALLGLSPRFHDLLFNPATGDSGARRDLPKPFTLIPPLDAGDVIAAGQAFSFDLTLFGNAIHHFPICLAAIEHLGKALGLGNNRGKFSISAVILETPGENARPALDASGKLNPLPPVPPVSLPITDDQSAKNDQTITIHLETRLRLKHRGKLVREAPPFSLLIERLIGRTNSLANFYHQNPSFDHLQKQRWIEQAQNVRATDNSTHWRDLPRYSGRQKEWMKFGGLLGAISYRGPLQPFLPLLELGAWMGIGGKTSFGLGKYEMEIPPCTS